MRVALLILVAASAGCAASTTGTSPTPWPSTPPSRGGLLDADLAEGGYSLEPPGSEWSGLVSVPPGAVQVLLSVRFDGGAVAGFRATLGACLLDVQGPAPAAGQTLTRDCGAMPPGDEALELRASAPASGAFKVTAKLCRDEQNRPSTACPSSG